MGLFSSKKKEAAPQAASEREVKLSDGASYTVVKRVDCLGDSCPRPQLMTRKAVAAAAPDDVIEIVVDNPSSMEAIPPLCPELVATHLETVKGDRCWQIYVRKD